ncbi:hypothetical protein OsJ_32122 [Oryza sativa Japonica Group]|uniref:KIB1-4 beta-propeller domain-containing protein n=1 Tax=Oryza sativa subsp. japonica TaxID=39947 RepID=Q94GX7_ORYSJ|nr:hypothetical protein [Oryza sativa Japonica Group]EAZ16648.1 hypothetical protein OsJ_32122 [Oryza sativa Japonica Group]
MEAPYGRCRQAPTAAAPAGLDSGGRSTEAAPAAPAKCCWRRHEDEVAALAACQQLPSLKLALARSQELEPQSSSEIPFLTNAEALIVSGIYAAYALRGTRLGDHALLLGHGECFAFSAMEFPTIKGNHVYYLARRGNNEHEDHGLQHWAFVFDLGSGACIGSDPLPKKASEWRDKLGAVFLVLS